jgi:hypothetical protein
VTLPLLLAAGVYRNARDWLMSAWGLTEDQAITLLTVACDFNVHQVRLQQARRASAARARIHVRPLILLPCQCTAAAQSLLCTDSVWQLCCTPTIAASVLHALH